MDLYLWEKSRSKELLQYTQPRCRSQQLTLGIGFAKVEGTDVQGHSHKVKIIRSSRGWRGFNTTSAQSGSPKTSHSDQLMCQPSMVNKKQTSNSLNTEIQHLKTFQQPGLLKRNYDIQSSQQDRDILITMWGHSHVQTPHWWSWSFCGLPCPALKSLVIIAPKCSALLPYHLPYHLPLLVFFIQFSCIFPPFQEAKLASIFPSTAAIKVNLFSYRASASPTRIPLPPVVL